MFLLVAGFCFIQPLRTLPQQIAKAKSTFIWKLCYNFSVYVKGSSGLFCFLLSENSSHLLQYHYQNTDRPKVTSQPTTEGKGLRPRDAHLRAKDTYPVMVWPMFMFMGWDLLSLFIDTSFRGSSVFLSFCMPAPGPPISVVTSFSRSLHHQFPSTRTHTRHPCVLSDMPWRCLGHVQAQRLFWLQSVHVTLPL